MRKSCLIIIDMQTGIFHQKNGVFNSDTLISNITRCIRHAFEQEMQVVITQHENKSSLLKGSKDWRVINPFQEFLSKSYVLEKKHPSIFKNTNLQNNLEADNITSLHFCGLVSNGCVKAACMESLKKGFTTKLISDAHSTFYNNPETIIASINSEMKNVGVGLLSTPSFVENCT